MFAEIACWCEHNCCEYRLKDDPDPWGENREKTILGMQCESCECHNKVTLKWSDFKKERSFLDLD